MAEKYLYYTLSDLLPPGSHLAVNTGVGMSRGGILTVITEDGKITGQESVTDQELSLLLALLEDYPYHCPYEHLLAAMWNENVDVVRTRLNRAADHGTWDLEIRSIRNTMNRANLQIPGSMICSPIE